MWFENILTRFKLKYKTVTIFNILAPRVLFCNSCKDTDCVEQLFSLNFEVKHSHSHLHFFWHNNFNEWKHQNCMFRIEFIECHKTKGKGDYISIQHLDTNDKKNVWIVSEFANLFHSVPSQGTQLLQTFILFDENIESIENI